MSHEQEQCLRTKLGMLKGFDIITVFGKEGPKWLGFMRNSLQCYAC